MSTVSSFRNFFRPLFCAWAAAVMVLLGGAAVVQAQPQSRWSSTNTQGLWASGGWSGSALQDSSTVIFSNNAVLTTTNNANASWRYTGLYMTADATSNRVIVGDFNLFGEYGGGRSKIEISTAANHRTLAISGNVSINGNRNQRYEINPVGGSIILGSISGLQTNSGGVNNTLYMYGNNAENDMVRSVVVSNGINGTGVGANILKLLNYANLVLMGNSTYTGNAEIDTGTLMLGQGTIDGTLNNNTAIYVGSGTANGNATLRLGKTDGGQVLGGSGVLQINTVATNGTRRIQSDNTSGTNTITRGINQNAQLFITNAAGGTLRFEGAFATTNDPSLISLVIQGAATNAVAEFAAANSFSNVYVDYGHAKFEVVDSWGLGRIALGRNAEDTREAVVSFGSGLTVNANIEARTNGGAKTILYTMGSGTLTLAGNITNNATGTARGLGVDVASGGTVHASGDISGGGGVTKEGSGRLLLSAENSYTGGTVIEEGTLEISGNSALGTGDVTVNAGGTLAGSGTIAGMATVHGTVAPGASPGLLDFEGDVTFEAFSMLNLEISSAGVRGVNFDAINVGGTLNINPAAMLVLAYIDDYEPQYGDTLQFLDFSFVNGEFIFDDDIGGGLSWDTANLYITGEMKVVPEPSTWVLAGMGAVVMFWFCRRRRALRPR